MHMHQVQNAIRHSPCTGILLLGMADPEADPGTNCVCFVLQEFQNMSPIHAALKIQQSWTILKLYCPYVGRLTGLLTISQSFDNIDKLGVIF